MEGLSDNIQSFSMQENRIKIKAPTLKNLQAVQSVNVRGYTFNPRDSIGLGYISKVYRGKNIHTNRPVAIKVIKTTKRDDLDLSFLQSETAILQKVKLFNCQHLLRLVEHFHQNQKIYIVTEYCQGKDLAKVLRSRDPFRQDEAQTIMQQLLAAYKQLYGIGVVHRDLKLSNLMLKDGKLILGDFGFAVPIFNCIEEFPYNAGSPYYMAPQSLKRNRFSFQSDVWALGVIAYELVIGKLPYKEKVESLQYDTIMRSDIEQKLKEHRYLSDHYKFFISTCLQKDMRKRASPQWVIGYEWPKASPSLLQLISQQNLIYSPPSSQKRISAKSIHTKSIKTIFSSTPLATERRPNFTFNGSQTPQTRTQTRMNCQQNRFVFHNHESNNQNQNILSNLHWGLQRPQTTKAITIGINQNVRTEEIKRDLRSNKTVGYFRAQDRTIVKEKFKPFQFKYSATFAH